MMLNDAKIEKNLQPLDILACGSPEEMSGEAQNFFTYSGSSTRFFLDF